MEQSPVGVDMHTELELHEIIKQQFVADFPDLTCIREQPFPGKPLSGPKLTDRQRCDFVLLPAGSTSIADPEQVRRERAAVADTLFAGSSVEAVTHKGLADPSDCFWLEIKLARALITGERGVRPNPGWSKELIQLPISDVEKLAEDPLIERSALAILAFGPDERTVCHDLDIALTRALDRGVALRSPIIRGQPITDRIGNAWCSIAVWPVSQ
ncbi:MAG: hypothetical protein H6815_00935 [Phycisphaeraceae bacterium]|nr:hypothetical protein [Phycisphaerales bacterium]MCB9858990.1 hypothetical protein [Phycisphaeraceae bacterium]